jgi:chromosomal replication initiator protein
MEPTHEDAFDTLSATHNSASQSPTLNEGFWTEVCDSLRPIVGREFDRWFSGLNASANPDGEVVIDVPNPINQVWIESNYANLLDDALVKVLGGPRVVRYSVRSEAKKTQPAESQEPLIAMPGRKSGSDNDKDVRGVVEQPLTPATLAEAGLNPKFSFDTYVVGPTNNYSAAVARAVAEKPGRIYNPLFLHSEPGLGKTHLLHAIGREIMFRKKRVVVRYVTSETFTNEFLEAIRKQTFSQFRQKYRKVDVLLMDDIQFFAGKESTQEEFFHTFNDLFNNTKQLVLASDKAPSEIPGLEERLVSRCEWGLTAQIQAPDLETRVAILRSKMLTAEVKIEDWILELIAQRVRTDVRKLEGCLMRVASRQSLVEGRKLTADEVDEMLRDVVDAEPGRNVSTDRIQRTVCERYDIRMSEMIGRGRPKMIAEARQVAMYLTRMMAKLSLVDVGKAFGNRDHGTVIHAVKVIEARMEQGEDFRKMMSELRSKISAP